MENDVNNNIIAIKQLLSESIEHTNYDYIKNLINKNVKDCNLLYTQVCYLIKLFLLNDYENNNTNNDYEFDEQFIRYCFRLIKNNGLNCNENKNNIELRIYNFYIDFNLNNDNKIKFVCSNNISSITHITDALSRDIHTNIKNNIIINYFKYINEYVNINLNLKFKNNIDIKIDSKHIFNVFNDIVLGSYNSNIVFHNWIMENKKLIIPNIKNNIFIESIDDGIQNHYKIFTSFIKKYIRDDLILNDLIIINDEKKINQLIKSIYSDIITNTLNTNSNYHSWIEKNKLLIVSEFNKKKYINLENELESKPFSFIPYMLYMNKNLEINNSKKKYQIIPLRTNLTPKFITINIDSLVDLLDSKYLFDKIKNYYHNDSKKGLILFDTYFNFTSKYIKKTIKKGYVFSGSIQTNGYEIIFNFNSKSYEQKKNNFHSSGKIEKKFIKETIKELSKEEKEKFINENIENKNKKKKEKEKLSKEKLKINKKKEKEEKVIKLGKIKLELDLLNSEYENDLNELSNKHYKILKIEFDKIDKTKTNSKDKMNELLTKLNEKLLSDKTFITFCYKRNKDTLIDDLDSNFDLNYNKIVNFDIENDKKINEIKLKILTKKKELIKLKKSNKVELVLYEKKYFNDKKVIINTKRLLEKIRIKTELLNYETKDKNITITMIKNIKLNLTEQIKKIYQMQKYELLNEYLNMLTDNNIIKLEEFILEKSTFETKLIFELCIKYILLKISIDKDNSLLNENKILNIKNTNLLIKENNKTINYKNKYKKILNELSIYSNELNKLIKIKNKNENNLMKLFKTKSNNYMEIDSMSKKSLEILNKMNWVVIDPGINSLLTMLSKDGKINFSYTKEHHMNRTNRKKMTKKIEKIKKEKIIKLENKLTKENERLKTSNDYKKFKSYFNIKMEIHNELEKLYNDNRLNKIKWNMFINEKRSEKILVNDIKKKFGNNVVLILGNWSKNKIGIKIISTPNKKYEKILEKNFITLKIDEFRTSIIHNKTEKKCENYIKKYNEKKINIKTIYSLEKLKEKNKERYIKAIKDKKIHKILVCKTNEKLNEHVNRDTNSVKNMIKIVSNYIKTNYKPKTFVLGTKICNDTLCVM